MQDLVNLNKSVQALATNYAQEKEYLSNLIDSHFAALQDKLSEDQRVLRWWFLVVSLLLILITALVVVACFGGF